MILERKRIWNVIFQALFEKSVSFIYSKNSNPQDLCLTQRSFYLRRLSKDRKTKVYESTVVTKALNKFFLNSFFFILELKRFQDLSYDMFLICLLAIPRIAK